MAKTASAWARMALGAAALALVASCAPSATTTPAAPAVDVAQEAAAIRAAETQWASEWGARDATKVLAHYAPDALLMLPNAPAARGTDAIRAMLDEAFADQNFTVSFAPDQIVVAASGDLAYATGAYTLRASAAPRSRRIITETGRYVTVYKRESGGAWLVVADIVTPEPLPAPAATPPAASPPAATPSAAKQP